MFMYNLNTSTVQQWNPNCTNAGLLSGKVCSHNIIYIIREIAKAKFRSALTHSRFAFHFGFRFKLMRVLFFRKYINTPNSIYYSGKGKTCTKLYFLIIPSVNIYKVSHKY